MTSREEFEAWEKSVDYYSASHEDARNFHNLPRTEQFAICWQAARATVPAWHDAPTAPGLWLSERNNCAYLYPDDWAEPEPYVRKGSRWYGPIPQESP